MNKVPGPSIFSRFVPRIGRVSVKFRGQYSWGPSPRQVNVGTFSFMAYVGILFSNVTCAAFCITLPEINVGIFKSEKKVLIAK